MSRACFIVESRPGDLRLVAASWVYQESGAEPRGGDAWTPGPEHHCISRISSAVTPPTLRN